ncbi:hypothetical protein BCR35DRAFT_347006 [Leucosporidium creatinivorum]|uniref:Uncharacterized protein n=1 Tax=Leucosporidium creatinivorum TaxID=106004 RepID=A0A1Y2DMA4_9BASI|nr:hypothetical protein BCR35DRAFT_347006 [Leucosporidium creatinivorum]
MTLATDSSCDLLILGAGWTFSFLFSHLAAEHPSLSYIATTRDGRNGTLKWAWDAEQEGNQQYEALPRAKTVLITFPIKGAGGSRRMVEGYQEVHGDVRWIQLGSTGIFDGGPTLAAKAAEAIEQQEKDSVKPKLKWMDRHSSYSLDNPRAIAEDELLSLRKDSFVLNLCGLWVGRSTRSGQLDPRIAPSKAALGAKGSVHFIHGLDVARAIIAVHLSPSPSSTVVSSPPPVTLEMGRGKHLLGQRFLLTDLRVYDWWDLASAWAASDPSSVAAEAGQWVLELMEEHGVRALPRSPEEIGRAMDSREFWRTFGLLPAVGRWERARA